MYDWIIMPIVNPDGYEYSHTDVSCQSFEYGKIYLHNVHQNIFCINKILPSSF